MSLNWTVKLCTSIVKPCLLISPFLPILKWQTFQKWNDSSLALNEVSSLILDMCTTGPICSRNSVWHRIPSKKRGSVHTDSLWFINRRKTHHSNKPDLSKLKLFTFSWPATADISELLLITLSLQFRAFLKCYMVSAWEDLSSKNQFKINTYRPTELKVLAYNQKYLTLTE